MSTENDCLAVPETKKTYAGQLNIAKYNDEISLTRPGRERKILRNQIFSNFEEKMLFDCFVIFEQVLTLNRLKLVYEF